MHRKVRHLCLKSSDARNVYSVDTALFRSFFYFPEEGYVFNRFYADCMFMDNPIDWEDMI